MKRERIVEADLGDHRALAGTVGPGEFLFEVEDFVAVGIGLVEEVGEDHHFGRRHLSGFTGKGGGGHGGKTEAEEEYWFHRAAINATNPEPCQRASG